MEALKASVEMAKKTGEVEVKQTRKRRKKAAGE
jgi:hypothetical protein